MEGNTIELKPNVKIHKISFSDINKKNIGYSTYNRVINMLCLQKDDITKFVTDKNMDVYTFLILYTYQSIQEKTKDEQSEFVNEEGYFIDELISVLELLFNDTVVLDEEYGYFCVGNYGFLYQENFYDFQSIIRTRNCLENIDEEKDNPANAIARQLLEKRKKAREKLAKLKAHQNNDEDSLSMADLISIYAEAEHMKLDDVFQYDVYQFNNQFNRMKIFKDYDVNIQALLAGAKSDDVELQHWLSKIKIK